MNRTSMVLLRVAGSAAGMLAGGVLVSGPLLFLQKVFFGGSGEGTDEVAGRFGAVNPVLFLVVGGILGATVGATLTQRALRQRSSFWRALLGAAIGLLAGVLVSFPLMLVFIPLVGEAGELVVFIVVPVSTVAGAVVGSGRKALPAGPSTA